MIPEGYSLKKFLCLLLCALMILSLSACGKKDATDTDAQQDGSFAPETTAVIGSGLAQAIASVEDSDTETASDDGAGEMEPVVQDEPIAQDVALDVPADTTADGSAVAEATPTPEATVPQPPPIRSPFPPPHPSPTPPSAAIRRSSAPGSASASAIPRAGRTSPASIRCALYSLWKTVRSIRRASA